MKSLLAAAALITAALSFRAGMSTGAAGSHLGPAGPHVGPASTVSVAAIAPAGSLSSRRDAGPGPRPHARPAGDELLTPRSLDALNDVVDVYCIDCHSDGMLLGNLSLEGFDIGRADTARMKAEKVIRKLRAEMMPLAGRPRPPSDTLQMVATAIERVIDRASPPNAGSKTF